MINGNPGIALILISLSTKELPQFLILKKSGRFYPSFEDGSKERTLFLISSGICSRPTSAPIKPPTTAAFVSVSPPC